MNALETMSDEEQLKEVWVLSQAGEWVEGLEWSSSFQIFEDLIVEERLKYSVKPESRIRASIYEEIDFYSLEERCLKFVF